MKKVTILLITLLLVLLVACSGKQTIYMCADGSVGGGQLVSPGDKVAIVCPNGMETSNIGACTFPNKLSISQKEAETKSINFVNGYVRTNGWTSTLINVYPETGNFYGQIVVSKNTEQPYETLVQVNGTTGTVSCVQNCVYLSQIS